jgi:drug/metabolite transporter (DMT)-like permease
MKPVEYLVLFVLAALWGASFLFIKVAVADMTPLTLVTIRLTVGTLGLLWLIALKPHIAQGWRSRLRGYLIVAMFNAIIPYLSISWGEQYISSGMAAILDATTPLGIVIIGSWLPGGERITWTRILGMVVGFLGVAVLVGPAAFSVQTTSLYLWGVALVLLGALSYSVGALSASRLLTGLPTMQPAIGQNAIASVILVPIAAITLAIHPQHPIAMPIGWAIASALTLALGGTSLAYLCYYWLLSRVGPTRTLIVTYLLPCMALVYGALLLHESVSWNAVGGLALVLTGVFVTGKRTEPRKATSAVIETTVRERQTGE